MKFNLSPLAIILFTLVTVSILSCHKNNSTLPQHFNKVEIAGTAYSTLKIGSQTWTVENFKGTGGAPYDGTNSRPEYGRYYSYNEMKALVLPAGWRVPSTNDFIELGESQGMVFTDQRATKQEAANKLISTSRWLNVKGTNQSGFNAFPGGYIYNNNLPSEGDISEFWTADGHTFSIQESADRTTLRLIFYSNSSEDGYKFNIRFVRDN